MKTRGLPAPSDLDRELLDRLRKRFKKSARDRRGLELFAAIRACAISGLPLPDWVQKDFVKAYDIALEGKAMSWEAAFGLVAPKDIFLSDKAWQREELKFSISMDVTRRHAGGQAIGTEMFEEIGQELSPKKSASAVRDLYYGRSVTRRKRKRV